MLKQIGEKAQSKNKNRVNREAIRPLLRMYDVGGKLLNGIQFVC